MDKCSKCQKLANGTSYYKEFNINVCTLNCPQGFYEYDLTLTCEKCDQSCVTCNTGPFDCQNCNNVSGIVYYLLNNQCLQLCPLGYYGDQTTN